VDVLFGSQRRHNIRGWNLFERIGVRLKGLVVASTSKYFDGFLVELLVATNTLIKENGIVLAKNEYII